MSHVQGSLDGGKNNRGEVVNDGNKDQNFGIVYGVERLADEYIDHLGLGPG
jgi:hypothetical protein